VRYPWSWKIGFEQVKPEYVLSGLNGGGLKGDSRRPATTIVNLVFWFLLIKKVEN
jgi:hypothetical protein